MSTIQIKSAGTTLPKVEKYAKEIIVYKLDCTQLLETNELIVNAKAIGINEGVVITKAKPRDGTSIDVTVANQDLLSQVYQDFVINISYETTLGNTRIAAFQLRVYK